ncbi:MAG: PepSY domain-containing protein, partial [Sphingomonadales bacterium]
MAIKQKISAKSFSWHRALGLIGGVGLLVWGISGLLHPIMVVFGPQPAVFYPPSRPLDLQGIKPINQIVADAGISSAAAVKVIVSEDQNLLQVTEAQDEPRRYFELNSGRELKNYDQDHAVFLARHFLKTDAPIRSIQYLTAFNEEYPAVNRLLPVYKVSFERDDDLSIYIYTETNAANGVSNAFKEIVQSGFSSLHTWNWFPREADWARVVLIGLFVGSLFALAATGTAMLVTIRRKKRLPGSKGWHRIAGYALALPLLMFTSSGLFHLITMAAMVPQRHLKLSPPVDLSAATFPIHEQWADFSHDLNVNNLSLIQDEEGRPLYRLGLAPNRNAGPKTEKDIRNARFDGVETTGPALYIDARTGLPYKDGDKELALQLGERFTGVGRAAIENTSLVTRFGPGYDFRNKRLPVWQLDYGAPVDATLFVDTTTGVLADRVMNSAKVERFSFSFI